LMYVSNEYIFVLSTKDSDYVKIYKIM
jgi:hypothetical protein